MESVDTRGMRSVCFGISDLMMQIMLPAKDFAALDIRAIPRFPHVPSAPELDNFYFYRSVDIVLKPEAQKNDKEHVCSDPFDYWRWVSLKPKFNFECLFENIEKYLRIHYLLLYYEDKTCKDIWTDMEHNQSLYIDIKGNLHIAIRTMADAKEGEECT